jgi:hypothetical protein
MDVVRNRPLFRCQGFADDTGSLSHLSDRPKNSARSEVDAHGESKLKALVSPCFASPLAAVWLGATVFARRSGAP